MAMGIAEVGVAVEGGGMQLAVAKLNTIDFPPLRSLKWEPLPAAFWTRPKTRPSLSPGTDSRLVEFVTHTKQTKHGMAKNRF